MYLAITDKLIFITPPPPLKGRIFFPPQTEASLFLWHFPQVILQLIPFWK